MPYCAGTMGAVDAPWEALLGALPGPACLMSVSELGAHLSPLHEASASPLDQFCSRSAGKACFDVHGGSFCVTPSPGTHLFSDQRTGSFLVRGPKLLNSCIIERVISILQLHNFH